MRSYLALTWMAVQRAFAYRAAAFAGLFTNFFFGLLRASVMVALFAARQEMSGMDVDDAIAYTGLTQASIGFLTLFGWFEIAHSVNNGQVGSDLLKPVNFYGFWMAQDLGRALVNLLLRGLPIILFYEILFDMTYPSRPGWWMAAAVSMLLAWLTSFAFRFLINLSAFWVPNAIGVCRLFYTVSWILSGFLMPLRFYPDWFVRLCYLTPFPHMVNTPVEVYLGLLDSIQLAQVLVLQAVWCVVLMLLGQAVLSLGVRRLVVQGG